MLFAQKEERSRQFSLALRAGLPILLFVAVVLYATVEDSTHIIINLKFTALIVAIVFVTVYFIYFLISLSVKESLIEESSQRFNKNAFIRQIQDSQVNTLGLLRIKNLQALAENYSHSQIDHLLYTLTYKLDLAFKQQGLNKVPIGRYHDSEFLMGIVDNNGSLEKILEKIILDNKKIDTMEIDYAVAIISNSDTNLEKSIIQLQDIIRMEAYPTVDKVPTLTSDAKELSKIEQNIIKAIQEKNIVLTFKPLLNTQTKSIDIYEISVKLKSATEEILPRVFLPIINRLGLGRDYDFILISHVIELLTRIGTQISFSFNLSPYSLRDLTFQTKVFQTIEKNHIDPSRLIIQLYERKTHHNLSSYLETLEQFKHNGLRICIDNFGSSNASIEYMNHFKFDMVQFDRDYVTKLNNTTNYTMLQSLVQMSKDLTIITIAKWVDTKEQEEKLATLGVDYLQGFGISKPITEHELLTQHT